MLQMVFTMSYHQVYNSVGVVTALLPHIGYKKCTEAAAMAVKAHCARAISRGWLFVMKSLGLGRIILHIY